MAGFDVMRGSSRVVPSAGTVVVSTSVFVCVVTSGGLPALYARADGRCGC